MPDQAIYKDKIHLDYLQWYSRH